MISKYLLNYENGDLFSSKLAAHQRSMQRYSDIALGMEYKTVLTQLSEALRSSSRKN